MKRMMRISRDRCGDWSEWRIVWVVKEYKNCWRIWSWYEPFTRLMHKQALGEKLTEM